ncbi:MAG: 2-oxoacid:acceptor oxidoreductase family protein [Oscillospiraceae bacterium]
MAVNMLIAGFGGQGVLFVGKIVAYTGMIEEKQVSWLPSYGPEMRGGTSNCSVCIDDKPIGCPIVLEPQTLIVMNRPSYDKFINDVAPGGQVIFDSTLIDVTCERTDINVHAIPATKLANDNDLHGLANIIILGQTLKANNFTTFEVLCEALKKCVPAKKQHLLEPNIKALKLGYEY